MQDAFGPPERSYPEYLLCLHNSFQYFYYLQNLGKMEMFARALSKKTLTTAFIALLVSAIIAASLCISPVKANPIMVEVSPTGGTAGDRIQVSGNDATPNAEVRVYLSIFIVSLFMAETTANSTGGFAVELTVPQIPAGSFEILVRDITTDDTATVPFEIEPKIQVDPSGGSCSDIVTVTGYGFSSDTSVTVEFNGIDVTPWPEPRTDPFGTFIAAVKVPLVPKGSYNIEASDGTYLALASYSVNPKVRLNPTSGPTATLVLVNGTGFAPDAAVSIEFGDFNVTMYPSIPTEWDGSFMHVFFVPDVLDGDYTVNATDETGNTAVAQFWVPAPVLALTPDKTSGSSLVTATGSGFLPNQPILLYLEGTMMVNLIDLMVRTEAISADESGHYEYSFIVPVEVPGEYRVVAYGLGGGFGFEMGEELASAQLTIIDHPVLLEIRDKIASIVIPDLGVIKENLTTIDARLIELDGSVATINSTIGLIQADIADIQLVVTAFEGNVANIWTALGEIEGVILSIEGDTAIIETDVGTIMTQLSSVESSQTALSIPLYACLVFSLIAGIGAIYLSIIHIRAMRRPSGK